MSILYNKNEFVEFFDTEHVIDQEKNITEYGITYSDDARFTIKINPIDELVILRLTKKEFEKNLFTVNLTAVKKIVCDATTITLYEDDSIAPTGHFFQVILKPYISWRY